MNFTGANGILRVAFDASALKPRYQHHGIQVYARNLLSALQRVAQPSGMEIRPFFPPAKRLARRTCRGAGFLPRNSSLMRFDRLWRYGGSTAAAFLDGADIMLNPNGASLPIGSLLHGNHHPRSHSHGDAVFSRAHCLAAAVSVVALREIIGRDYHCLRIFPPGYRSHLRRPAIESPCCV